MILYNSLRSPRLSVCCSCYAIFYHTTRRTACSSPWPQRTRRVGFPRGRFGVSCVGERGDGGVRQGEPAALRVRHYGRAERPGTSGGTRAYSGVHKLLYSYLKICIGIFRSTIYRCRIQVVLYALWPRVEPGSFFRLVSTVSCMLAVSRGVLDCPCLGSDGLQLREVLQNYFHPTQLIVLAACYLVSDVDPVLRRASDKTLGTELVFESSTVERWQLLGGSGSLVAKRGL